jgi:mono/diheme cytochrome c family protein
MKKALRYLLIVVGIIAALAGGFAAFVAFRGIPSYKAETVSLKVEATPARVEQGQKLAAMLCSGCHMDPNTGKLTGRRMDEAPQFGAIYSKNITKHPEYGIGNWTDGQLAYLLRTGIKPDGTFLPIMAKLSHMSDEDIHSIIAYLRSDHTWVQPDNTRQPQTEYSFLAKFITNIGAMKPADLPKEPIAQPDTTDAVKWGRYIAVSQLECFSCHSRDFAKNDYANPEKSEGYFGGGNVMIGPDGKEIVTRNLTMDEETGLGKWTEEEFIKAVKYGQVPHGQALRQPMMPYTGLTDNEAKAIYAYLKTIPKINNKVERN